MTKEMAVDQCATARRQTRRISLRDAADVAALEHIPFRELLPRWSLWGAIDTAASACPDKAALVQVLGVGAPPSTITFGQYRGLIARAANLFRAAAGQSEPVVAVILPFVPEAFIAMWGGGVAGRYVPINPFLDTEHVASILRAVGANILVTARSGSGRGIWERLPDLLQLAPCVRNTFLVGTNPVEGGDFGSRLAEQAGELCFVPDEDPLRVCANLHTGGTTGRPKLVRHTQEGQLLQAWLCGMAMGCEEDVVFGHAMPDFHVGGAIASLARGIVYTQTIVTLARDGFRDPDVISHFWDIVRETGITSIVTAPTTAAAIAAASGKGPSTLRRYITGGSALPSRVGVAFQERFGLRLKEVWGGTEFHGILSFHYDHEVAPRVGSCGRIAPYHRLMSAVLDGQRFVREAAPGERGILIATGPALVEGYVDPREDEGFFIEGGPDGLRWASTGDIGLIDDDAFVWIQGREKDVIIRGGHNIDSALIDEVLAQHPAVLHAAAVGRPCPSKGELPVAYVELRPDCAATVKELMEYVSSRVQERAAVPVEIILLAVMPMTAVGKVSKPQLRMLALRTVGESECPGMSVDVEDKNGRLTLVVRATSEDDRRRVEGAFADYTFPIRIEGPGIQ